MSDNIKIRVGMEVGYIAGSTREDVIEGPPRTEWEAMTDAEREQYLEDIAREEVANTVSAWAVVDDADQP